ncbi:MAG: hypothetical protein WCY19_02700 [Candidatus Gastranaerophilaceae bacterium]
MKYIKSFIIEIFTTLLIENKPIEIEKDYWWDEGDNIDGTGEERKPELQPFSPYFEQYLDDIKLKDIIIISDAGDKSIITLQSTIDARKKLKEFLQNYMNLYKKGKLQPYKFVNYFPYMKNLDYMRDVLYKLSHGFKQTGIVLYSYRLLKNNRFPNKPDLLADERIRLSEFILDIYFHPKYKKLIKINSCEMKRGGFKAIGNVVLEINISLLEHPDVIYSILAKQLTIQHSIPSTKANKKMRLKFPLRYVLNESYQKPYIQLAGNKVELTPEQYDLVLKLFNKTEEFGIEKKTMVSNINKKIRNEFFKDKKFKFIIGIQSKNKETYYAINRGEIVY